MLLRIAWRNLFRNNRRTLLTLLAIVFATFLITALVGIAEGVREYNIKNMVAMSTGHLQIQHREFMDNPSMDYSFELDVEPIVSGLENIEAASPRIIGAGLASKQMHTIGVQIMAFDPAKEAQVTTLPSKLREGRMFNPESFGEVVVGYRILDKLNCEIGDTLVVLAQSYDGSMGNFKFEIVGTVRLGEARADGATLFMSLGDAEELMLLYGLQQTIALSLKEESKLDETAFEISQMLPEGSQLEVRTWKELMRDILQFMEIDRLGDKLIQFVLIVLVGFGVLNTVLMSVTERFQEFGILLAMGMKNRHLVQIILLETVMLTIAGIFVGLIIGTGINFYFYTFPVEIGGDFGEMYEEYGFQPVITATLNPILFLKIVRNIILISILAWIPPAIKTLKLEPLKGIRYT